MKKLLYVLLLSLAVGNAVANEDQTRLLSDIQGQLKELENEGTREVAAESEKGKLEVAKEKVNKVVNFVVNDVVKEHPYMSAAVAGTLAVVVIAKLASSSDRFGYKMDGENKVRSGFGNIFDKAESGVKYPFVKIGDAAKAVDTKTSRFGYNSERAKNARAWASDNAVTNFVSDKAGKAKAATWTNRNKYSRTGEVLTVAAISIGVVALYKHLKKETPEVLRAINDAVEENADADLEAIINILS